MAVIYNSRNSFGLLAERERERATRGSTIVEIHLAY